MTGMADAVVLDASALIAAIYAEKGAASVDNHLAHALISTVNLTEVASYMVREGTSFEQTQDLLKDLSLNVVEYDEDQALLAAQIVPITAPRGLSLGDRACLALAMLRRLPVLTADKAWAGLGLDLTIELIR